MKKLSFLSALLFMSVCLSSCGLIEDLFKGGLIIGLIIAALIIGLLAWIFFRAFKKRSID